MPKIQHQILPLFAKSSSEAKKLSYIVLVPGSASTSSSSSSSSSNTGYTRQSNPRPRAHKHPTPAVSSSSNTSTTSTSGTVTAPIISSLPPSAISAAPYIPTSMIHQPVDYHHGPPPLHHIHHLHHPLHMAPTYAYMPGTMQCPDGVPPHAAGPPPPGVPTPPLNPAGTAWMSPYYPAPIYDGTGGGIPTFVHHVTPPTPSATTVGGTGMNTASNNTSHNKSGSNRMSPSPQQQHLVHPPANNTSYCQNHSGLQAHPPPQQHVVSYHLQHGEVISLQLGDGQVEVIQGKNDLNL